MARLFMGSGLDAFNNSGLGEAELSYTGGLTDSFNRCGMNLTSGSQYADTPEWTAVQELWLHWYSIGRGTTANGTVASFYDGTTEVAKFYRDSGVYKLAYLSGASTFTQVGSDMDLGNFLSGLYIDIYLKTGASGAVGVYVNGVEQMTDTASMTYAPDITKVRFGGASPYHRFCGVCVDEEQTIGRRVAMGYPSGNGANTAWVGDYTSVDDVTIDEADYCYSNTADEVETFTQSLHQSLSGYTVKAVAVSGRFKRGSTGPQNAQLALRSGGTDYFSSSKSLGLGYSAIQNIWDTNPDTAAEWNNTLATAVQPGMKSIT